MAKRAEATSPPDNVHTRTLAKHTTTPEVATARPAPSVSQVLAAQRADQTIDRAGNIRRTDLAEGSPAAPLPTAPDTPAAPATSKTALEQHLAELAGTGGRYLQPDGSKGIHRTTDDDVEMPMPATFLCPLQAARWGHIMFPKDGSPPKLFMVGIAEETKFHTRESLGDNDPENWEFSEFTGQRRDPYQEQIVFPIIRTDSSGEIFTYVARGAVALRAVRDLLGRWRWHPKRQLGLTPVVEIGNGTYKHAKFGDRPKPTFKIVDWVRPNGSQPAPQTSEEVLNDTLPF